MTHFMSNEGTFFSSQSWIRDFVSIFQTKTNMRANRFCLGFPCNKIWSIDLILMQWIACYSCVNFTLHIFDLAWSGKWQCKPEKCVKLKPYYMITANKTRVPRATYAVQNLTSEFLNSKGLKMKKRPVSRFLHTGPKWPLEHDGNISFCDFLDNKIRNHIFCWLTTICKWDFDFNAFGTL